MDSILKYFELQKEIFEYFGYTEDWKKIPLSDDREYWWYLVQNKDGSGYVIFAKKKEDATNNTGEYFRNEIYTQRFLPKYVYRGKDFTMIACDTRTDDNKLLGIFDNAKEIQKS
jgi:hypothetical protein